jgi:dTDP-4-amino-4,6-dideoxygalactose transaminase
VQYNVNPLLLENASTPDTVAVIVQHTYGIPCDMQAISTWAAAKRISLIEDCCHCFGSRTDGRLCGTFGEFAFFSGQWNKPFSTGLGGFLLVNNPALADKVEALLAREAKTPGRFRRLVLRLQILAHESLVTPRTMGRLMRLYRKLNKLGLVVGSSTASELREDAMPVDYLAKMAPCQVRKGLRELGRIHKNISHRLRLTAYYHERLPALGFAPLGSGPVADWPLLRYPVRVANKEAVLTAAVRERIEIGSWFDLPLHDAEMALDNFGYRAGQCPQAELACREVINLPTHLKVDLATANRVLDFLQCHAQPAPTPAHQPSHA